jgi:hypothetical protein
MFVIPLVAFVALQTPLQRDSAALRPAVVHRLAHLGLEVTDVRTVDPTTGIVHQTARDQFGNAVDLSALLVAERRARYAATGKLSHELAPRVDALPPEAPIDVVFWLVEPEHPDFFELIQQHVSAGIAPQEARALVLGFAREVFAGPNQAFAQRLTTAGFDVKLVGEYWPNVFATMPAGSVREWAADPDVDVVYYNFSEGGPEQNNAQGTMRTFNVRDAGVTGASGPTKVLVNDCGEVTTTHSWLPPVIQGSTAAVASHPCGVAGNICMSNGSTLVAAAAGLPQLYSHDGCGSDLPAQTAWAWGLGQNIDLGNCSWWNGNKGSIVFLDRFFDYTIRNFNVMLFKSNGNQGTTGTPYATSPGNGYNMICSGSYGDANNVNWADDAMATYSSYWNPVEGHEKPEVATPGDGTTSTGTSGTSTQNFNGTSSASPLACGVATLVANTNPAILGNMTTLKAAMMVSAWHNVEGADVLSDKDGAGGVHATAAHAVVRDGQYIAGTFTNASFPGGFVDFQVNLNQQDPTRIMALWFSDPDAAYSTDLLKMDLDMTVLDPQGQVVASSANAFNPFELLKLTPTTSGVYTIRLTRIRFDGTSEPYTIAWSSRLDEAVANVTFATTTPSLGSSLTTFFRSRYETNVPYVCLLSAKPIAGTFPIVLGRALPLARDRWTRAGQGDLLQAFVSNYRGTLNAVGEATGTFFVPSNSAFLGWTFRAAMYTHEAGNPTAVRETSDAAAFTIVP